MRVLMLSNMFPTEQIPNGGTFITRRVEALQDLGVDVALWALGQPLSGPESLWNSTGEWSLWQRFGNRLLPTRGGLNKPLRTLVRSAPTDVDLVVSHGMFRPAAGAIGRMVAQRLNVPHVIQMHGSDINVVMNARPRPAADLLRSADATIYVSTALRERARALGAPSLGSHVVPNGVDTDQFRPSETAPSGGVIFIGNLLPVKGADRLPEIFAKVSEHQPGTHFTVVGDGPLRSHVEVGCAQLGHRVTFVGAVPPEQVSAILRRNQVLVVPSRSEGWPCTVLEAHASGVAVVGTDVGGVAEAIGDPLSVVPDDESVTENLSSLISRTLQKPSLDSSALVERAAQFSWKSIASRELEIFHSTLNKHPRAR